MTMLLVCAGCQRHVRSSDSACPFCGAAILDDARAVAASRLRPSRGLPRAVLFGVSVGVAATGLTAACGSEDDDTSAVSAYGGPGGYGGGFGGQGANGEGGDGGDGEGGAGGAGGHR